MKPKWIKVYEAFNDLSAREKCAVFEALNLEIPQEFLSDIEFEKHFGRIKVAKYK